jgi:hypothetical protein
VLWGQDNSKISVAENVKNTMQSVTDDLREARITLKKVADKEVRERLELLIGRAELQLSDLRKDLPLVATVPTSKGMSDADFARLLKSIKGLSFDDQKLDLLRDLGKTPRFTASQVRELVQTFSFDDKRVEAAVLLHPFLQDAENFYQVLEVFTFDSHRNAVRERLKGK